jgi:hypothetical protein
MYSAPTSLPYYLTSSLVRKPQMIEISSLCWLIGFFKRITFSDSAFLTSQSSAIAIYKWIPLSTSDTTVNLIPYKPEERSNTFFRNFGVN